MSRPLSLTAALSMLIVGVAAAAEPSTAPVDGLHQNTPTLHALVGATIVTAPGKSIEKGTIVIRDGVVTSVSRDRIETGGSGPAAAVFQVLIRPAATALSARGARAELKSGLTLTARFHVARRTLLELLHEDASAWLNPQDPRAAT